MTKTAKRATKSSGAAKASKTTVKRALKTGTERKPAARKAAKKAASPAREALAPQPMLEGVAEVHTLESADLSGLQLVDYAEAAARALQAEFPALVFTSGRRNSEQQARAMAGNIVRNRKWIEQTYAATPARTELQGWVDSHPGATTRDQIAAGLIGVMSTWPDSKKKMLSRHFSGQAFDMHPVAGEQGEKIKAAIHALPNFRKFFDNEGGLIIWHADFEKA